MDSINKAEEFLKVASEFNLGNLFTEQSHPETMNLSNLSQNNLPAAIRAIRKVDAHMIETLIKKLPEIEKLSIAIKDCLLGKSKSKSKGKGKGRIFLCGCGATGRLSLVIETLWRQVNNSNSNKDSIISFMAGGDVALISSIEKFEDYPDYGVKQLSELGFSENDLFIGSTEGGETPFVIGATQEAEKISKRSPFFLYCNPDGILKDCAKRSISILENTHIKKLNLTHGAQALSGSTRMQASSIIMMAIALALFEDNFDQEKIKKELYVFWDDFFDQVLDLEKFVIEETEVYNKDQQILYAPSQSLAISVLTDTTERAPTFSLDPFENYSNVNVETDDQIKKSSLSYLYFPLSESVDQSWEKLLFRKPRTLQWEKYQGIACLTRLRGFQFHRDILNKRKKTSGKKQNIFKIIDLVQENLSSTKSDSIKKNGVSFEINAHKSNFYISNSKNYYNHLFLKMLMNTMSTLIMGRLGRYSGNIMTWVKPSNNKLIDRAVRYALKILKEKNINTSYSDLVKLCFKLQTNFDSNSSLVDQLVGSLVENDHEADR